MPIVKKVRPSTYTDISTTHAIRRGHLSAYCLSVLVKIGRFS